MPKKPQPPPAVPKGAKGSGKGGGKGGEGIQDGKGGVKGGKGGEMPMEKLHGKGAAQAGADESFDFDEGNSCIKR